MRSGTIGLAVLAAMAFGIPVEAARAKCSVGLIARLPVTMDGLRASVPVEVNGKPTKFWLDSGAFYSIMPKAKAAELGLKTSALPMGFYLTGIGGATSAEVTTIKSFKLVGNELKNLEFIVGGSDVGNGLIGQNILALADTEYDLANGTVNLMETKDCRNTSLAYWATGKPFGLADLLPGDNQYDRHIYAQGEVNGKPTRMLFDTGAPSTIMTRAAAERAGIDLAAAGVVQSESMGGFGAKQRRSWIVTLKTFSIGGEEIRNTPIRVIEEKVEGNSFDMLVGADFFLSHRLFVSRATRRIYLTYNGGPVFSLTTDGEIASGVTRTEGDWGVANEAVPTDAAGFARRAAARAARQKWADAVADYDEAIKREPANAAFWSGRADAQGRAGAGDKARADFDHAIKLAPNDPDLLIRRGFMREHEKDDAGALADVDAAVRGMAEGSLDRVNALALYDRLQRPDRALALLDPIIALHRQDSKLGPLLNSRCWSRALANTDLDKALADCNAAIKRDGAHAAYLDSRAMVRVRQHDYAGALADYEAALAKEPKSAATLYMRGWVKRAMGKADEGAADMAAAKVVDPEVAEQFIPFGFM
jgi:clan AA aspartic protease (TIGR02281 family)